MESSMHRQRMNESERERYTALNDLERVFSWKTRRKETKERECVWVKRRGEKNEEERKKECI